MKKLAIVTTHPVQYNAPLFRLLAERKNVKIKVFYTWEKGAENFDEGFGKSFTWDIPLLKGYEFCFVSNNGNTGKSFWDVKNPGLIDDIDKWKPDAVLVYGWNYYSHLEVIRNFKGKIKVLFRGDSTLIGESRGIKQVLRRFFLKWVYSYVDMALYVGSRNKEYFLKHGLKENQLTFVPHAIDNDRFGQESESQRAFQRKLLDSVGLNEEAKVILFAGKFQKKKNARLLLEAFKELSPSDWNLILLGNGPEEEELRALAQGTPNIYFLPFQNQMQMPVVYRLGNIFCLPSQGHDETWGLAVNEAMASGRAVIVSSEVGCAPDLVENGVNGFIFESGNIADLKEKIGLAITSDTQQTGRMSKQKIRNWRFDAQAEQIESLLSE